MSAPAPLCRLGARDLLEKLGRRDITATDVVEACLGQIRSSEPLAKAWTHLSPELARAQAIRLDENAAAGAAARPLTGVPVGVKDVFNTIDMPTQMGSLIWKDFTPGNDSRVVFGVRQAGAVILGKTATAEFAVHQLGETLNPHHPAHTPGTSSSGSAAAIAAYHVPVALGTQTAGSIVRPASYCGVYGFKPSFGLLPRTGVLKTTDSLDTLGYFTRKVEDLRLLFEVIRVKGPNFPISSSALADPGRQSKGERPWRVLVARPHTWEFLRDYTRDLFTEQLSRWSAGSGVELVERELPKSTRRAHEVHAVIYNRTLAYYFAEEYRKNELVSPVLKDMIERGQRTTLDEYKAALAEQERIAADVDSLLGGFDVLATPSVAGEAPLRNEAERPDSCLVWTLCGLPAINVPAMVGPQGLPIGIQLASRRYNDYLLLSFVEELSRRGLAPDGPYPVPPPFRGET